MADEEVPQPVQVERPPAALIQTKSGFSLVWLIPLIAVLIGAWLTYRAFSQQGPTVTITFETGEGLVAGKTKVKYRDIEIGIVEEVRLAEDLTHVVVTAELTKGTKPLLRERTRFWVVRARIAGGRVTGLGTLLAGAHIGIEPALEGKPQRVFRGLEVAPVITTGEPGQHFNLRSEDLGSIDVGSPVFFRSVRVGQVVQRELAESGEFVTIRIFVEAPHDRRVRQNTRFWNASGLDVSLDADGIRLDSPSVVSMLIGGVAFDTPANLEPGAVAGEDHVFSLYRNRRASLEKSYTLKRRFLLHFDGSVKGLVAGSPVLFSGIKMGEVVDLRLQFDHEALEFRVPVLIELEPERIEEVGVESTKPDERLVRLVERGLRARLARGNLITGQLQIELEMYPDAPPAQIDFSGPYPELPTIPTTLDAITTSLARLVDRLAGVPIEEIGTELQASLKALRETLGEARGVARQLNEEVAPAAAAAMAKLDETVASVNTMLSADSPTRRELQRALTELAGAARSVRLLADYLEQHPEALLRGKEE